MNWLKKHTKLLLAALVIIIVVVSISVVFLPSILNIGDTPAVQYYNLNQEIAGFPTENTSMTFASWAYSSSFIFTAEQDKNLVILNFTLRNIADTEIGTSANLQYLSETAPYAPREAPLLKYGDSYATAKTDFPYSHYWGLWATQTTIPPNESLNGYLIYEILKGNTPTELVFPNAESPRIIIRLQ